MAAARTRQGDAQSEPRSRRDRDNIRELLLDAAIAEFGQNGFEAASTTSIADRADAHQPQINYHFSTKAELWRAAVDRLFAVLNETLAGLADLDPETRMIEIIRRTVRFAAERPQLNQIMLQESMVPSDRLVWLTETYVQGMYDALRDQWRHLREIGVAAPVDERLIYYVLIGSSSLPFANQSEAAILIGPDHDSDELVEAHIDGLVAMLLPGRSTDAGGDTA
jgi:TetR/AcrR family transcriptional regulator